MLREVIKKRIATMNTKSNQQSIKIALEKVTDYNQDFECIICLTLVYDPH